MTRRTKNLKTLPIIIREGKREVRFLNWKAFNWFKDKLLEIERLNNCLYFEAKKGTSDILPMTLKKALKNPIIINKNDR